MKILVVNLRGYATKEIAESVKADAERITRLPCLVINGELARVRIVDTSAGKRLVKRNRNG